MNQSLLTLLLTYSHFVKHRVDCSYQKYGKQCCLAVTMEAVSRLKNIHYQSPREGAPRAAPETFLLLTLIGNC